MTFFRPLLAATPRTPATPRAIARPTTRRALTALAITTALSMTACRTIDKPVTPGEAQDFADKIEASVAQHNPAVLDSVIDSKYFAALILRRANQRFNFTLAAKAKASLLNFRLGREIIPITRQTGTFQLVRRFEKDGHQHLLFRLFKDDGDIGYYDFELIKSDLGVRADDVYIYESGEQLSKAFTWLMPDEKKPEDMTAQQKENLRLVRETENYLKGANPEEAETFYIQIPDSSRKDLRIQRLHVRLEQKQSDSAYKAALAEYKADFPQDPYIYFTMFRTLPKLNEYRASLDALDRFDALLPSDPYLDFYRGLLYKLLGDPLQSRLALERFHARWPNQATAMVQLVANHLQAGHADSAAMLLKEAQRLGNLSADELEGVKKAYPALNPYLK